MKRKQGLPGAITMSPNPIARSSSCAPSGASSASKDRDLSVPASGPLLPFPIAKLASEMGQSFASSAPTARGAEVPPAPDRIRGQPSANAERTRALQQMTFFDHLIRARKQRWSNRHQGF